MLGKAFVCDNSKNHFVLVYFTMLGLLWNTTSNQIMAVALSKIDGHSLMPKFLLSGDVMRYHYDVFSKNFNRIRITMVEHTSNVAMTKVKKCFRSNYHELMRHRCVS